MPPRRRLPGQKNPVRNRNGAEGSVWRRIVSQIVGRDFGVCWVCRHTGANSADHVLPVAERPDLSLTASNLKAVHGYPVSCPVCSAAATLKGNKPVYCNELRSALSVERARKIIETRTGLTLLPQGQTRSVPGERDWD